MGKGITIHPKLWKKSEQRPKTGKENPNGLALKRYLDQFEDYVLQLHQDNPNITVDQLKKQLDVFTGKDKAEDNTPAKDSFNLFVADFIRERTQSPEFSVDTIKTYKTFENHLNSYSTEKGKGFFVFNDINDNFAEGFKGYLFRKGLQMPSVAKYLRTLKTVMQNAFERSLHENRAFKNKSFSIKLNEPDTVYLDTNELEKIEQFDLSDNVHLVKVREWLIIASWTGLRISDLKRLDIQHIRERINKENGLPYKIIEITPQKVKKPLIIPVFPAVEKIINNNGGQFPVMISEQALNREFKDLCKICGLNEVNLKIETKGGESKEVYYPKYELISTHTGRRSFISNLLAAGISASLIKKMTGHKKLDTFDKYDRITREQTARIMTEHPFFLTNE